MKLLMMGTGPFAVPAFRALAASGHDVCCLITRPEKASRGRKNPPPNPMREVAEELGIEVFAPTSINEEMGLRILDEKDADLFVVCDYGQILSKEALSKAKLGGINLHGSLLPKYRGAAPINWAILNGDDVAGITVIHMTPRLDGGPMICKRSLDVGKNETAEELEPRLSEIGVEAVLEAIEMLESWDGETVLGELQNKEQVTKAPRLKKSDGQIDWSLPAELILNRIRALQPWPGTFSNLLRAGKDPMRVIIKRATLSESNEDAEPGSARATESGLVISCGKQAICVARIQPAGKREMDADEFCRGYGAELRFGTE